MRELQNRQKMKRRIYSIPALLVLLAITIGIVRGAYALMQKERQSARDAEALDRQVSELASRETELKADIDKLHTEGGIEEEIKAKYNVARPGERVAIIIDRPGEATTTAEEEPWYVRFWNAIRYDIVGQQ